MDFFNRYNEEQNTAQQQHEDFKSNTKDYFSQDFKGFDISVGEKKFRTLFGMTVEEQIEEILEEANAYGLRNEVKTRAKKIIRENDMFSEIDAYVRAYYEIIEQHE